MEALKVCATACGKCLLGATPVVSEAAKRAILADCLKADSYFVCHKFCAPISEETEYVCCRAFYGIYKNDVLPLRLAQMLNAVEFVPFPTSNPE